jgi:membrane protease YdiL (CAAX protease family)
MKKYLNMAGFIILYLILLYGLSDIAGRLWWNSGLLPEAFLKGNYDLVTLLGFAVTLTSFGLILKLRKKSLWKAVFLNRLAPKSFLAVLAAGLLLGCITSCVVNTSFIQDKLPIYRMFLDYQFNGIGSFPVFLVIVAVMYAGEEMIFRGVIYSEFLAGVAVYKAMLLSVAVYGLINIFMIHPAVGLYAAVAAFFYSIANIFTNSLFSSITLQIASVYIIAISWKTGIWKWLDGLGDGVLTTAILVAVIMIAVIYYYLYKNYKKSVASNKVPVSV